MNKINKFIILSIFTSLISCQRDSYLPGKADWDTQGDSCSHVKLLSDFSLTAGYLRSLIACMNGSDSTGALSQSEKILDTIGNSETQSFLNLIFSPHPEGDLLGYDYPYLAMISVILDRGLFTHDGQRLFADQRSYKLQEFLLATKPQESARMVLYWAEHGWLGPLLDQFSEIIDSLPQGFLSGHVRLALTGSNGPMIKTLAEELLGNPYNYDALRQMFLLKPFKELSVGHEANCIRTGICIFEEGVQNFWTYFKDFWDSQPAQEKTRTTSSIASVIKDSLTAENDKITFYLGRLGQTLRSYIMREEFPASDLSSILFNLHDTQLKQLSPLMTALQKIRDNPTYFDAFQEKIGSSRLQEQLEDFLWHGGSTSSCAEPFQGMSKTQSADEAMAMIHLALSPEERCAGLSRVDAYIVDQLGEPCGQCSQEWLFQNETLDQQQWQDLMDYAIGLLAQHGRVDPWYFMNRNLAFDGIQEKHIKRILELHQTYSVSNLDDYLILSNAVGGDDLLRSVVPNDFMDRWLNITLEKLSSLSFEFSGLNPSEGDLSGQADYKLNRILAGVFTEGPVEQALRQNLSPMRLKEVLTPPQPISLQQLSFTFGAAADPHALFRNKLVSFKGENEDISRRVPGSIQNFDEIDDKGKIEKLADPLKLANILWGKSQSSWSIRQRYWDQIPLISASFKHGSAASLNRWILNDVQPLLEEQKFWDLSLPEHLAVPKSLFRSTPYSREFVRLLTLYSAQIQRSTRYNYKFEAVWQANDLNKLNKSFPIRGAFNPSAVSGSELAWTAYNHFHSGFLNSWDSMDELLDYWQVRGEKIERQLKLIAASPNKVSQGFLSPSDPDAISEHEKDLLLLQAVSFIYEDRESQYLQPLLAPDQYCSKRIDNEWIPADCPAKVDSLESYLKVLQSRTLETICPYIAGSSFSTDFRLLWRSKLGFQDRNDEILEKCYDHTPKSSTELPHEWMEQSLRNIVAFGENPTLLNALKDLPTRIAAARFMASKPTYYAFRNFIDHTPTFSALVNSTLLQRQGLYKSFTAQAPNLIDFILNNFSQKFGLRQYSSAIKKYGTNSGQVRSSPITDLIDIALNHYDSSIAQGHSLMEYGLIIGKILGQDPDLATTLLRFMMKNHDPYSGILMGYTLPQAIKANLFRDFSWDNPDYYLVKDLLAPNHLLTSQGLLNSLDHDGIELFKSLYRIVEIFGGTQNLSITASKFSLQASYWLKAADQQNNISKDWKRLSLIRTSDDANKAAANLLLSLNQPLADLDNNWQPSSQENLESVVGVVFEKGPMLINSLHQASQDNAPSLGLAMLGLSHGLNLNPGSQEFFSLLQDSRMGLRDGSLYDVITNPTKKALMIDFARGLNRTEAQDWLLAIPEWQSIIPACQNFSRFVFKKAIWQGPGEGDFIYFMQTLNQFSNPSSDKLDLQVELLKTWLIDSRGSE